MVVAALLVVGLVAVGAKGGNWYADVAQDGSGDYTTIQGAIDAFNAETTYADVMYITILDSATYTENLSIKDGGHTGSPDWDWEEHEIKCAEGQHATIDGSGGAYTFAYPSKFTKLTLSDLTIIGGTDGVGEAKNRGFNVTRSIIKHTGTGIPAIGPSMSFTKTTFIGDGTGSALYASGAIDGWDSYGVSFTDCTFVNEAKAIDVDSNRWVKKGGSISVDNCLFADSDTGLELDAVPDYSATWYPQGSGSVSDSNFDNCTNTAVNNNSTAWTLSETGSTTEDAGLNYSDVTDLTYNLRETLGYGDDVNWSYIPEPATMSVLALGAVGLLLRRKRR